MGSAHPTSGGKTAIGRRDVLGLAAAAVIGGGTAAQAANATGQIVYGVHISLAPTWFDPAETPSLITP
jgi:peptide/nickel transport system substrate-binding protein